MRKKCILWPIMLAFIALVAGCDGNTVHGKGSVVSQQRQVGAFTAVQVGGRYQLVLRTGSPQKVMIATNQNLLPYVKTAVTHHTLHVSTPDNVVLQSNKPIQIMVQVPKLEALKISGAVKFSVRDLDTEILNFTASGMTQGQMTGQVKQLKIKVSGAGMLAAKQLIAQDAKVKITGKGRLELNVEKKLSIHISGAGQLTYWGHPQVVKQTVNGGATIVQASAQTGTQADTSH